MNQSELFVAGKGSKDFVDQHFLGKAGCLLKPRFQGPNGAFFI